MEQRNKHCDADAVLFIGKNKISGAYIQCRQSLINKLAMQSLQ